MLSAPCWAAVVTFVAASAVAIAQPSAPPVQLVEELRLDATKEDFPTVGAVYVGPASQIVVPIQQDQQLRIYDPSGKRLGSFGRRGAGPGEFGFISQAGWIHDTMWVLDFDEHRTTFIGPDHRLVRTTNWPVDLELDGALVRRFDPMQVLPGGQLLGTAEVTSAGQDRRRVELLRASATGLTGRLLTLRWLDDEPWMMRVGIYGRTIPFALRPLLAADGRRVALLDAPIPSAQDAAFQLSVFTTAGDSVIARSYPYRGVPIPRASIDSALAAQIPPGGRAREGPADMPPRFQAIARERMPRWYIPVESIALGLDRTIWIALRPTDSGRGYLILNGRGDPIGSLTVKLSTRVRQASGTHVWVTETDDDGLSSVVRYRVVGLNCGPPGC